MAEPLLNRHELKRPLLILINAVGIILAIPCQLHVVYVAQFCLSLSFVHSWLVRHLRLKHLHCELVPYTQLLPAYSRVATTDKLAGEAEGPTPIVKSNKDLDALVNNVDHLVIEDDDDFGDAKHRQELSPAANQLIMVLDVLAALVFVVLHYVVAYYSMINRHWPGILGIEVAMICMLAALGHAYFAFGTIRQSINAKANANIKANDSKAETTEKMSFLPQKL